MTNLENALVWIYIKTWGKFGDHVIEQKNLWHFDVQDLETALTGLAYPRKRKYQENEKSERIKAFTDLIMEKFENVNGFHQWSLKIHQENIENLSETSKQQEPVKIPEWDFGKCLRALRKRKSCSLVS